MKVAPVQRILERIGAPYCLIGGHAMAARGYPRFTVDVDFLTSDSRVLERSVWSSLTSSGATVDPRRGDSDDPLAGVVQMMLAEGTDVDLVVAKWQWDLKLAAGGHLDRRDAAVLMTVGDRETLIREVESRIADVRPDVNDAWRELRQGP